MYYATNFTGSMSAGSMCNVYANTALAGDAGSCLSAYANTALTEVKDAQFWAWQEKCDCDPFQILMWPSVAIVADEKIPSYGSPAFRFTMFFLDTASEELFSVASLHSSPASDWYSFGGSIEETGSEGQVEISRDLEFQCGSELIRPEHNIVNFNQEAIRDVLDESFLMLNEEARVSFCYLYLVEYIWHITDYTPTALEEAIRRAIRAIHDPAVIQDRFGVFDSKAFEEGIKQAWKQFDVIAQRELGTQEGKDAEDYHDQYALELIGTFLSRSNELAGVLAEGLKKSHHSYCQAVGWACSAQVHFDQSFCPPNELPDEVKEEWCERRLDWAIYAAWEALAIEVPLPQRGLAKQSIDRIPIRILGHCRNNKRADHLNVKSLVQEKRALSKVHNDAWAELTLFLVKFSEEKLHQEKLLIEICDAEETVSPVFTFEAHLKVARLGYERKNEQQIDEHLQAAERLATTSRAKRQLAAFKVQYELEGGDIHVHAVQELMSFEKSQGYEELQRRREAWNRGIEAHEVMDQLFLAGNWDLLHEEIEYILASEEAGPGHRCHAYQKWAQMQLLLGDSVAAEEALDHAAREALECEDKEEGLRELAKMRSYIRRACA